MSKIIINIKRLVQIRDKNTSFISANEMSNLPSINNAYLVIKDGLINDFGKMSDIPKTDNLEIIDAKNKFVLPAWCDSHTHSVFTSNRAEEYIEKIRGVSYQEIWRRPITASRICPSEFIIVGNCDRRNTPNNYLGI